MNGSRHIRVAVVGAGPAGLTAAALLKLKGVDVTLFEKRRGTCTLPQAHVINARTCEIFRQLGILEQILALAAPDERLLYMTWAESIAGRQFGKFRYHPFQESGSLTQTINLAQDKVEQILAIRLATLAVDLHFASEVVALTNSEIGAELQIRGPEGKFRYELFDYVLACDGASSLIRKLLHIVMKGPASLARFASCYFTADLDVHIMQRPGAVNLIAGPDARGCIIGYDMKSIWAFMCVMPPEMNAGHFSLTVMTELVRRAIADPAITFDVLGVGSWNMSAQVADRFRKGRFFLVGDAAHRFPPSGGLGLNTSVQDAHNIAWKVAAVAHGFAHESLLDSYEPERQPVAQKNCDQSLQNAVGMNMVDNILGVATFGPVDPAVVHRSPSLPANLGLEDNDPHHLARRAEIQGAIDTWGTGLNLSTIVSGYRYAHFGGEQAALASADESDPAALLGGILPHVWMESATGRVSSLDVIDPIALTLIVGNDTEIWSAIARRAAEESGYPVITVIFSDAVMSGTCSTQRFRSADANRLWSDVARLNCDGAVLVRPDDHVLWRRDTAPTAADVISLRGLFSELSGRFLERVADQN